MPTVAFHLCCYSKTGHREAIRAYSSLLIGVNAKKGRLLF